MDWEYLILGAHFTRSPDKTGPHGKTPLYGQNPWKIAKILDTMLSIVSWCAWDILPTRVALGNSPLFRSLPWRVGVLCSKQYLTPTARDRDTSPPVPTGVTVNPTHLQVRKKGSENT